MKRKNAILFLTVFFVFVIAFLFIAIIGSGGSGDVIIFLSSGFILLVTFVLLFAMAKLPTGGGSGSKGTKGPRGPADRSFRSDAKDHGHITPESFGHDKPHELQQLDSMLEAGLIDQEEYRQRRSKLNL